MVPKVPTSVKEPTTSTTVLPQVPTSGKEPAQEKLTGKGVRASSSVCVCVCVCGNVKTTHKMSSKTLLYEKHCRASSSQDASANEYDAMKLTQDS